MVARERQVPDPYAHSGPWTEEEFLALPVDTRLELVDGALVISPSGANPHQRLAYRIWGALDVAATTGCASSRRARSGTSTSSTTVPTARPHTERCSI